jgi:phage gp29-like protein
MAFLKIRAALAKGKQALKAAVPTEKQTGARSMQGHSSNYLSVSTLDPARLAAAFSLADQGQITQQAEFFNLIEQQNTHVYAEMAKRRRAITGLGWRLEPPADAAQAEIDKTKELEDMVRSIPRIEGAQYDLTDAIGKGFGALEIAGWQTGSEWLPKGLDFVPQSNFSIDLDSASLRYLRLGMPEPLQEGGWVVHEHRAMSGYIEQAALFRVLGWCYAYKAYNVQDMQKFLELYGLPLRLGKFPAGLGDASKNELMRAVRNLGNDGAGIIPNTMSIDFVQAQKSGSVDDFLNAIEYWERKESMAILGGTLTSQADGKTSTNALGEIHNQVRREIMLHDVEQLQPTLQKQLVEPIALINGMFNADRMPCWAYQTEESVDQAKIVEVLEKAVGMGFSVDKDWAHKTLQIPMAQDPSKALGFKDTSKPPLPTNSGQAKAAKEALSRLASLAAGAGAPDAADDSVLPAYIAQLSAISAPFEAALVQKIASIVAESGGFDEALAAIEQLNIDHSTKPLAETLALGLAAAHLAGRAEAL